jgi:hypothetical protein
MLDIYQLSQLMSILLPYPVLKALKLTGKYRFGQKIFKQYFPLQVINQKITNTQNYIFVKNRFIQENLRAIYLLQTEGYDYGINEREIIFDSHKDSVISYGEYPFHGANYAIVDTSSSLSAMTTNDMFILEERYNSLIYVVTRQQNSNKYTILYPDFTHDVHRGIIVANELEQFNFKGKIVSLVRNKRLV